MAGALAPQEDPASASPSGLSLLLGGLLLALLLAHHPMLRSGFERIQGDTMDARLVSYLHEHGYRWIRSEPLHRSFWDPPVFHPVANTAAYTHIVVGTSPPFWLWRALGLAQDAAYQAWLMTMTAFNYAAAWLLLRRGVGVGPRAAMFGALLLAVGSPRIAQIGHAQLLGHFYTLFALLALIQAFRWAPDAGRRRAVDARLLLALGCGVGQLYASFYLTFFLQLALLIALAAGLAHRPWRDRARRLVREHAPALAIGGAAAAVAVWPLGRHYLDAAAVVGTRDLESLAQLLPGLPSWLAMPRGSFAYGWSYDFVRPHLPLVQRGEHRIGMGLLSVAVALLGLAGARRRPLAALLLLSGAGLWLLSTVAPRDPVAALGAPGARLALAAGAGAGVAALVLRWTRSTWRGRLAWLGLLSLCASLFFEQRLMLWRGIAELWPAAGAIRAVPRVGLMLLIPLAIGVAVCIDRVRRPWLALAVGTLCVAEQAQDTRSYEKRAVRGHVERLARDLGPGDGPFLLYAGSAPRAALQLDAMEASLRLRRPTVNGYMGNQPPGWGFAARAREPGDRAAISARLRGWERAHALRPGSVQLVGPVADPRIPISDP